jgi:phosphoribosylformimino-5-aminoimidazole carboxamide ribotide isomerase
MYIIPAIDIMGGKVIRLSRGEPKTAKRYKGFEEPLQVAKKWEREGTNYLHVIDIDAATSLKNNRQIISSIIRGVSVPVQVGGGIRSIASAEEVLNAGASRVIVSTLAFENEDMVKTLIKNFGCKRVMVALDYLNGKVMTHGWKDSTGITLEKAMEKFLSLRAGLFLLTSISKDGLLSGPDYTTLKTISKDFKEGLFVAGGITTLDDLVRIKTIGVEGVIVGKALYEGKFSLEEAINAVRE